MADYEFTSPQKLAVIDGKDYIGKPITVDQADQILTIKGNAPLANRNWVSCTFSIPLDEVGNLPSTAFYQLLSMAMEVNGLVPKGEAVAAESPSTSDSSSPTS